VDVAGAEAALLYWVQSPRPGAATGLLRQHGLLPADYQPLPAVPSRVRSLSLKAAGRYVSAFPGSGTAGVVLVPVQAGGRLLGTLHLYCREVRPLAEVQMNTLALLGQLVGYVHRHCLEAPGLGEREMPAGSSEPAPLAEEPMGLFREGHFHRMLNAELDRASRYGDPLGLILLTVGPDDGMPEIGSRDMQQLLACWSAVLPALLRRMDYAFVLEPGTFAVLLPRSPEMGLQQRSAELQAAFCQLLAESFPELEGLHLRMGGAIYQGGDSVSDMLQQAAAGLARAVGQQGEHLVVLQRAAPHQGN
jgi:GGDEF domain-containing protein